MDSQMEFLLSKTSDGAVGLKIVGEADLELGPIQQILIENISQLNSIDLTFDKRPISSERNLWLLKATTDRN